MPNLRETLRLGRIEAINAARRRQPLPPWLWLPVHGPITEFPTPSPFEAMPFLKWLRLQLPKAPVSVSALRRVFEQVAFDPRVRGVVLDLRPLAAPATYQSLRGLIRNLRKAGKRVVAYAEGFGPYQYYLACACDAIVMPPSAEWAVMGLSQEHVFFKDALEALGVEVEVIHVSPFKSAGDALVRNDFSEEARAQAEWLIDAQYEELVNAIANGRALPADRVRGLIDSAPIGARQAVDAGLIDAALYPDQLEDYVTRLEPDAAGGRREGKTRAALSWLTARIETAMLGAPPDPDALRPGRLADFDHVAGWLMVKPKRYAGRYVGVVTVDGMIAEGAAQPVPVPGIGPQITGSDRVVQALRKAERDPRVAAIVLHVNSPGGSALASDLIAREVERVQRRKPVVAYLGGVAASGGYYVAALTRHIVAQPLTITGSIGVILTKPAGAGALRKLRLHTSTIKRGAHADAFGATRPFSADERQSAAELMNRVYGDFKRVVARGRNLDVEQLEPICGGRVWTGRQALEHRLIDTHGDFADAVEQARVLANVPAGLHVHAVLVTPARGSVLPLAWRAALGVLLDPRGSARRFFGRPRAWLFAPFLPQNE